MTVNEAKNPRELKKLIVFILMLFLIGTGRLLSTLGKPQMEGVRGVDIVSLTGSGFAFGTGFGLQAMALARR
jgi:hypothetical protein